MIRDVGNEYGTVTGRPRRCGWLDAVATGYSARVCGVDSASRSHCWTCSASLDEIQVCEAYEIHGRAHDRFPQRTSKTWRPPSRYLRTLPGWKTDTSLERERSDDLPAETHGYLDVSPSWSALPVDIVSIGPDREQTIIV